MTKEFAEWEIRSTIYPSFYFHGVKLLNSPHLSRKKLHFLLSFLSCFFFACRLRFSRFQKIKFSLEWMAVATLHLTVSLFLFLISCRTRNSILWISHFSFELDQLSSLCWLSPTWAKPNSQEGVARITTIPTALSFLEISSFLCFFLPSCNTFSTLSCEAALIDVPYC